MGSSPCDRGGDGSSPRCTVFLSKRGEGRQRGKMRGGRGEMDGGGWCGQEGEKVRGVGGWPTIAFLA